MRRRTRLLAVLPLLGLAAVAACQPFHAGAAATVGDVRISTNALRQEAQRQTDAVAALPPTVVGTNATPSAQDVQRTVLGEQIRLAVLKAYAAAHGITVGANQVAAARATLVSNLGVSDDLAPGVEVLTGGDLELDAQLQAYQQAVADTLPASNVAIGQVYDSTSDHLEVRAEYAFVSASNPSLGQLAAALPTTKPAGFDALVQSVTGAAPTPASWLPAATLEQYVSASALKPGRVLGPITLPSQDGDQSDYLLLDVLAVRTVTLAGARAPGSLQRQEVQSTELGPLLAAQDRQIGIHVSPRFGAWTYPTAQQTGSVGGLPASRQLSVDTGFDASSGSASGS